MCSIFAGTLFMACCLCSILQRPIERVYFQFPWPFSVILFVYVNCGNILFKSSPTIRDQCLLCITLPCIKSRELYLFFCHTLLSRCMHLSFLIPGHMFYYSAVSCMLFLMVLLVSLAFSFTASCPTLELPISRWFPGARVHLMVSFL